MARYRFARHPGRFLGSEEYGAGRVLARGFAAVAGLAHGVYVGATGIQCRIHIGELALHQLELADRLAERLALVEVRDDHIHARLHNAQGPAREHGALVVETRHQDVDTAARFGQDIFLGHCAVLEHELAGVRAAHAQLVELLSSGKTLDAFLDDEGGDPSFRRRGTGVRVGLGVDHEDVGIRAVGDPHLAAVQDELAFAIFGAGFHRDDIRAGTGLGHRERADPFAGDELRQVFALLGFGSVPADLVDAQIGVRAVGQAHRSRGPADFLHRDDMCRITHHGAAVRLFHGDAEKSERAQLPPQIGGELVRAVDLGGARGDLSSSEAAHGGTQHVDVLAEGETQSRQLDRRGAAGEVAGSIHSGGFRESRTLLYVYVNVNHGHQACRARADGLRRLAPARILRDWRSNARISE